MLLRNNPIYLPIQPLAKPYLPIAGTSKPLPVDLTCDSKGRLNYEGYLNAWLMHSFAGGKLKDAIGEYSDLINYVPTSFNKVMDILSPM